MTRRLHPEYAAFNDSVLSVPAGIIESPAGAIILTHDMHKRTVAAAPLIIMSLKRRGIQFVTVTRRLEPQTLRSGHIYFRQPAASR